MKKVVRGWQDSVIRLLRFVFWYSIGVLGLLYVLPAAGVFLEAKYESLGNTARFASVLGFFVVVACWHVLETRDRWRRQ